MAKKPKETAEESGTAVEEPVMLERKPRYDAEANAKAVGALTLKDFDKHAGKVITCAMNKQTAEATIDNVVAVGEPYEKDARQPFRVALRIRDEDALPGDLPWDITLPGAKKPLHDLVPASRSEPEHLREKLRGKFQYYYFYFS
ncbi:MAG: hypothetical protein NXI16_13330 [Alphaproteobacteria bacterium]|nr:hypothetical protein [Alphaproteobacteria bacterium]